MPSGAVEPDVEKRGRDIEISIADGHKQGRLIIERTLMAAWVTAFSDCLLVLRAASCSRIRQSARPTAGGQRCPSADNHHSQVTKHSFAFKVFRWYTSCTTTLGEGKPRQRRIENVSY